MYTIFFLKTKVLQTFQEKYILIRSFQTFSTITLLIFGKHKFENACRFMMNIESVSIFLFLLYLMKFCAINPPKFFCFLKISKNRTNTEFTTFVDYLKKHPQIVVVIIILVLYLMSATIELFLKKICDKIARKRFQLCILQLIFKILNLQLQKQTF